MHDRSFDPKRSQPDRTPIRPSGLLAGLLSGICDLVGLLAVLTALVFFSVVLADLFQRYRAGQADAGPNPKVIRMAHSHLAVCEECRRSNISPSDLARPDRPIDLKFNDNHWPVPPYSQAKPGPPDEETQ